MRIISIKYRLLIIFVTIIAFKLLLIACTKKLPNLHESKWVSLTVEYLVDKESGTQRKVWSTSEQEHLDKLQSQLHVTYIGELWGIGTMTSNKVEVSLANGQKWIIYIVEPSKLAINDPTSQEGGYYLKVKPDFYKSIKSVIESINKEAVRFF